LGLLTQQPLLKFNMEENKVFKSLPDSTVTSNNVTLHPDGTFTCKYGSGTVFIDGDYWKSDLPEFEGMSVDAYGQDPLAALILFCDAVHFREVVG
jgi:hypothetical protein